MIDTLFITPQCFFFVYFDMFRFLSNFAKDEISYMNNNTVYPSTYNI